MSFIEFKNVKKTYLMGEVEINALNGVDFNIEKGEFVVIVGASGAGKSTILNLLGGMDTLSSGEIIFDNSFVHFFNEQQLCNYRRYDIGFVFQFYNLIQNLTAFENVELATHNKKYSNDDLKEIIESVGLKERINNFPSQLSGGEQQRVAIARALFKKPKLLLCDEPTGALDYQTGKQILKLLQNMCRKNNMTIVVVTHNLAIAQMADRVIKVKSGKVDEMIVNDKPKDVESIEW